MEIYEQLIDKFSSLRHLKEWDEVQSIFRRAASAKPAHWLLPIHVCESVSGNQAQAFPAMLAVACSHIGIVLIDDMLDADERGEYRKLGEPAVANIASALQSVALSVIVESEINSETKLGAMKVVNEMFLETTIGQYFDVKSIIKDEEDYWKIAKAKSSPFFSTSLQIGALFGGADSQLALQIKDLGSIYGEMVQIHDDVHDTLENAATPDWESNRAPLPILFASVVQHPKRDRFNELRPYARTNPKSLEEAQAILIQSGGISYCIYQLLERYQVAKDKISTMQVQRRNVLEKIFDDIVKPVHKLFNEIESLKSMI